MGEVWRYPTDDANLEPDAFFAGQYRKYDIWMDYYNFISQGQKTIRVVLICDDRAAIAHKVPELGAVPWLKKWLDERPEYLMRAYLMGWRD